MMRVLLVEDDATYRRTLAGLLRDDAGLDAQVQEVGNLEDALLALQEQPADLTLLDAIFPLNATDAGAGRVDGRAGSKFIETVERQRLDAGRIVVISSQNHDQAVQFLIAHRIHDYLFKDTPWKEVRARLGAQIQQGNLLQENRQLRKDLAGDTQALIGQSANIQLALERARQVGPVDTTALILGETGTGKELLAKYIHQHSARKDAPFIVVNCAALSEGVLESELFGHAKGAFTGAVEARSGRFELADKGTLFLDEVGEIPLHIQPKLLRVLQEQTFERVGESRTRKVDVRLISATNRDLEAECAAGRFRTDLYYRLGIFTIQLPPLRDRHEDVPLLVREFLAGLARKLGKRITGVSPDADRALRQFSWPGNIRQLRNTVEAAMVVERSDTLQLASLPIPASASAAAPPGARGGTAQTYKEAMLGYEKTFLEQALATACGNINDAATVLDLPVRTLRDRLDRCGLDPKKFR